MSSKLFGPHSSSVQDVSTLKSGFRLGWLIGGIVNPHKHANVGCLRQSIKTNQELFDESTTFSTHV